MYWVYTGRLPQILNDNAVEIFIASYQYGMNELKDWARTSIEKCIQIDNVLSVFDIAEMMGDTALRKYCLFFMANHYHLVSQDPAFANLNFSTKFEINTIHAKIIIKKRER